MGKSLARWRTENGVGGVCDCVCAGVCICVCVNVVCVSMHMQMHEWTVVREGRVGSGEAEGAR